MQINENIGKEIQTKSYSQLSKRFKELPIGSANREKIGKEIQK